VPITLAVPDAEASLELAFSGKFKTCLRDPKCEATREPKNVNGTVRQCLLQLSTLS
jgi:hypothetical protein